MFIGKMVNQVKCNWSRIDFNFCIALLDRDNEIVAKYFRDINLLFTAFSEIAVNMRFIAQKYFATISLSLFNNAIQISEVSINIIK